LIGLGIKWLLPIAIAVLPRILFIIVGIDMNINSTASKSIPASTCGQYDPPTKIASREKQGRKSEKTLESERSAPPISRFFQRFFAFSSLFLRPLERLEQQRALGVPRPVQASQPGPAA